jgi:hypothetical protein
MTALGRARLAILARGMCMQCVGTAMSVGAGATGLRVYLAARQPKWLTPSRLRLITALLIGIGVLAVAVRV